MKIVQASKATIDIVNPLFKELDEYHMALDPKRVCAHDGFARTDAELNDYIDGEDKALFLCMHDGIPIAFANVKLVVIPGNRYRVGRQYVLLDNLFVRSHYRRAGVGMALFARVRAWGKRYGVEAIEIQVYSNNVEARHFYKKLGFSVCLHRMEFEGNA